MYKYIDTEKIVLLHSEGKNDKEIAAYLKLSTCTVAKYRKKLNLKTHSPRPLSEEEKKNISQKRKEWLKNNPDKHPWRNKDKFQSNPCKVFKKYLNAHNIDFIEEYDPLIPNRFFSIDIAMPDKMIAIEINGNQHYERDGKLKPYYQERHNLLESNGWKVFEIHYSNCYHLEKLDNFMDTLLNTKTLIKFNYEKYIKPTRNHSKRKRPEKPKRIKPKKTIKEKTPKKEKKVYLCSCGNPIVKGAKGCMPCFRLRNKKVKERPTKEELLSLIGQMSMVKIGKLYGVSDNCVRKWLKQ
jgi:hypothetical protein